MAGLFEIKPGKDSTNGNKKRRCCKHRLSFKEPCPLNIALQMYSKSTAYASERPSNIMDELRQGLTSIKTGYKANLLKYAYQRNPDSLLDETLLFIWALMAIACAFTVAYGGYYHYSMLQSAFGVGIWSVVGSFVVFIALEIAKIYLGLVFTRSLFSMLWYKSIYRFLFTALLGFIVVVAFTWSINISTKGVASVNALAKQTDLYQSKPFTPPPSVAEIDRQIAGLGTVDQAAAGSTWRGVTTERAVKLMRENGKTRSELLAQKSALLATAQAQHDSLQTVLKTEITNTATLLTDYGGKAEYATIVLLLLIVLFEFINYHNNKAQAAEAAALPLKKA